MFWFLVVCLPALFLNRYLGSIVAREEKELKHLAKGRLLNEMDRFIDDLSPESYVSRTLDEMEKEIGFDPKCFPGGDQGRFVEKFGAAFRGKFGFEPFFLVLGDGGIRNIWIKVAPAEGINPPSKRAVKALLEYLSDDKTRIREIRGELDTGVKNEPSTVMHIATNLFGIIRFPFLPWGATKEVFNFKFAGRSLYLSCRFLRSEGPSGNNLLGGYFIIIPGWKIAPDRLVRSSTQSTGKNRIRRRLFWMKEGPENPVRFSLSPERLSWKTAVPSTLLSFFEGVSREKVPFLEVSLASRNFAHPWTKAIDLAKLLLAFFVLAFAALILHLWLFREAFPFPLRGKIILALGSAVFLPLVVFSIGSYSYFRYYQRFEQMRTQERLRQILEFHESGIRTYETGNDRRLFDLRNSFEQRLHQPREELEQFLDSWKHLKILKSVFFLRNDGAVIAKILDGKGGKNDPRIKTMIQSLIPIALRFLGLLNLLDAPTRSRLENTYPPTPLGKILSDNLKGDQMNEILALQGSSKVGNIPNLGKMESRIYILHSRLPNNPGVGGILFFIRQPAAIAESFFQTMDIGNSGYREIFGDYEIQTAIFPILSSDPPCLETNRQWPNGAGRNRALKTLARFAIASNHFGAGESRVLQDGSLISVRPFLDLPFVTVGMARKRDRGMFHGLDSVVAVALCLYTFLIVLFSSGFLTRIFEQPLLTLIQGVRRIRDGDLSSQLLLLTGDELTEMSEECQRMNQALRERERMRRFMSAFAVDSAKSGAETREKRVIVTVLFSDIRGFTELSETHSPERIVELLNSYFTEMEEALGQHGGVIDKFIGDAILAVFHPARAGEDHSFKACQASMEMREKLAAFNRLREKQGLFTIRTGVGLATGSVIEGRVGSAMGRIDQTIIGDTVHLASRLESASKQGTQTGIILSPDTAARVVGRVALIPMGTISQGGKDMEVFEMAGRKT